MIKLKVRKAPPPPKPITRDWELISELAQTMVNIEREINELKKDYNQARKQLACEKFQVQLGKKYKYRTDKSFVEGILMYRNTYDNRNEYFELKTIGKDGSMTGSTHVVLNPDDLTLIE